MERLPLGTYDTNDALGACIILLLLLFIVRIRGHSYECILLGDCCISCFYVRHGRRIAFESELHAFDGISCI